jgi:purine-cytosine permease-like protein
MAPEEKPTVATARASCGTWFHRLLALLIQGAILGMLVYIFLTLKKIQRGLDISDDKSSPYAAVAVYIQNSVLTVTATGVADMRIVNTPIVNLLGQPTVRVAGSGF